MIYEYIQKYFWLSQTEINSIIILPGVNVPCVPLLSVSLAPEGAWIVESEIVLLSVKPEADVLSLCVSEQTLWEHSKSESFEIISTEIK